MQVAAAHGPGRPRRRGRARGRALAAAASSAAALTLAAAPAAAFPGLSIVDTRREAAAALYDGRPGLAGLTGSFRQAPASRDPRWPAAWQAAKVSGRGLSRLGARRMAAVLRGAWESPRVGDLVGVDELTARHWPGPRAADLRRALRALGPDARRVVLYVGPALVSQVGRADPRRPLEPRLEQMLGALRLAGAVQLAMYQGGGRPWSRAQFAAYATRWLDRFGPADAGRLHLLLGPARGGVDHAELWERARSTPAGRALLANGVGVHGLRTAAEGLDWLRGYREFLADPAAPPPGGDVAVPTGGGLALAAAGERTVMVRLARPGRAVVSVRPVGSGHPRVIARVRGPLAPRRVRIPADAAPGRYRVRAVAQGDGLTDAVEIPFRVRAPRAHAVPDPRLLDAVGEPAAAVLPPTGSRAALLRRLVTLDGAYRRLLRRAARCRERAPQAERGLRRRALAGAAVDAAPGLRLRIARLAAGARSLEAAVRACGPPAAPAPTPSAAVAPPAPSPPVAGSPRVSAIRLRALLAGEAVDVGAEPGVPTLPASLVPVDVALLNGPACRAPGAVCVGLDRDLLQRTLADLASRHALVLALRGMTPPSPLLPGALSEGFAVERLDARRLRVLPVGPLAGLAGLPDAPDAIVGQLQAVPAVPTTGAGVSASARPVRAAFAPGAAPAERRLLAAVNRARAERGLPALRASAALARPARRHAAALARLGYLATRADRSPFWTRLVAAGHPPGRAMGESLARVGGCDPAGAEQTVRLWLASAPHRANLLSRRFRTLGAGAVTDDACGRTVYVADLGG